MPADISLMTNVQFGKSSTPTFMAGFDASA
jgi:hypothetical protein